jgi:hypothetical protein
MKSKFGVACTALAMLAGAAYGQCFNIVATPGTLVGEPGINDIGLSGDDATMPVFLPFPVTFFDQTYDVINVCTNGWASFSSTNTAYSNTCLPNLGAPAYNSVPGPTIYPFWDDLTIPFGSGMGVRTTLSGDPGSQRFTIEWNAQTLSGSAPHTFSVVLHENSTRIDFIYTDVPSNGASATIGPGR